MTNNNEQDEFEKELEERICSTKSKMATTQFGDGRLHGLEAAYDNSLTIYQSFKAKQEAKSTAPSSLIAELREWKKNYDVFPSMAADKEYQKILSRHESEARVEVVLVEALEKLSKLGNGDLPGNSNGNVIAQEALAKYRLIFLEDKEQK